MAEPDRTVGDSSPHRGGWTGTPRLQMLMQEAGVDVVVGTSPWNLIYCSGCHLVLQDFSLFNEGRNRFAAAVVPAVGEPVLSVWSLAERSARATSWITDIRPLAATERTVDVVASIVREMGATAGRVGIERGAMDLGTAEDLAKLLPQARLVPADPTFNRARMIKSSFEVETISRVGTIAAKAVQVAWEMARPGDTEYSVAANITANVVRFGAAPMIFHIGAGANSAFGVRWASDKRLTSGEVVHCDAKARLHGYWADLTRMAVVGEPSALQASVYQRLIAVEREIVHRMRPGVSARELHELSQDLYKRNGLDVKPRSVGHGIGLCIHEEPDLTDTSEHILEAGMVITVEPTHYASGERYHHEEIVVVTDSDPRVISSYCDTSQFYVIK